MYKWNKEILDEIETVIINGCKVKAYKNRPYNLVDMFKEIVQRDPSKIALIDEESQLSYQEVDRITTRFAHRLRKEGIQKGNRVLLLMKNTVGFCLSVLSILKLGAVVVPLNTKLKPNELEVQIKKAKSLLMIADDELISNQPGNLLQLVQVIKESEIPLNNFENDSYIEGLPAFEVKECDPAFILFTSGTTGIPKGAVLNHCNIIHAAINYERCYGINARDTTIIAVPIFHGTGLFAQFTAFLYLGGTIVLLKTFSAQKMLAMCETYKVTHTIVVPTIYNMLLNTPSHDSYQLFLRVLGSGGAALPEILDQKIREWIPGVKLINTYGLTEATSPAVIMPYEKAIEKIGSVGIPSPITESCVVDPETNQLTPVGQPGELLLKGPIIVHEYWENKEATSKAFYDGWFRTGDIALMDEDGFIYIKDRVKDMINRGGEKVYSIEVEDIIYRHPKVLEAAVVGIEDPVYGEVPKAYIVPKAGEQVTVNEIKNWAAQFLAKYKVPQDVEFIQSLPRNAGGKVIKKQLNN